MPDHNGLLIIFRRENWGLFLCDMKAMQYMQLKPQLTQLSES